MGQPQHLREAVDVGVEQANAAAAPADGDEPQPAPPGCGGHRLGGLVIGRDDSGATRRNELCEQPELGGEISLERRMIVQMITAEIGEAAGRHAHTVEPMLIEPVRGRFHRQMGDAFVGERRERAM
jgi:hypothetical protein